MFFFHQPLSNAFGLDQLKAISNFGGHPYYKNMSIVLYSLHLRGKVYDYTSPIYTQKRP